VVISEDQRELARLDDLPMLFPMAPFEGINVGIDRRSPVSWELHRRHGSFAYSGRIDSVRYEPGELPPDGPGRYIEMLKQMGSKYE
jgi:arylsulfatase